MFVRVFMIYLYVSFIIMYYAMYYIKMLNLILFSTKKVSLFFYILIKLWQQQQQKLQININKFNFNQNKQLEKEL